MSRPKFEQAALDMTYTKHLVAIDGVQPDIAENVREHGFEASQSQLEDNGTSAHKDVSFPETIALSDI